MANEYELSQKQKMLGMALFARHVSREKAAAILMVLEDDSQVDDLSWYMGQNPEASEDELLSVAYQLVKEAHENNG